MEHGFADPTVNVPESLLLKWRQIFHFLDVDNDSTITMKDLNIVTDKLLKIENLSPEKRDEVILSFSDMWGICITFDGKTMNMTQFLDQFSHAYRNETLASGVKKLRTRIFHCMDLNGDGKIDFTEFKILSVGRSEDPYMKQAFEAIDDDNDGTISLDEYVKAYEEYVCNPDVEMKNSPLYGLPKTS